MKKSYFVFAFAAFVLVSALGCSAQVIEEQQGTAGSAGGNTTSTPTPTDPIVTTGTVVPPVHEAGQVIVTDENSGWLEPDPAMAGAQNVVVLLYSVDALINDADVANHEFHLVATDGGSVVSMGGYPYFDGWKMLNLDTGALLLDGGMMQIMSSTELRVRFEGTLAVPAGVKLFVGLAANVFNPDQMADKQQLVDHEYRVTKTPYSEGDILDQNDLVVPASEVLEDQPMLGDPMVIVVN